MATVRQRKQVVTSPPIPGPNSHFQNLEGEKETVRWGREGEKLVYIEPIPVEQRFQKRQAKHPVTGETIWKDTKPGQMPKPVIELVEIQPLYVDADHEDAVELLEQPGTFINRKAWREYIVDNSLGNGTNQHVYGFREDPAIAARRKAEAAKQAKLDRLLETLAEKDFDPDDLTAALAGDKPKRGRKKADNEAA